jgi:photosystem II biogenesis protein Psp29
LWKELLVEMHLLSVNVDFRYDPIYALGVVTSFERFMQGYSPESDKASIFNALCQAVDANSDHYRYEAETLLNEAKGLSITDFQGQVKKSHNRRNRRGNVMGNL